MSADIPVEKITDEIQISAMVINSIKSLSQKNTSNFFSEDEIYINLKKRARIDVQLEITFEDMVRVLNKMFFYGYPLTQFTKPNCQDIFWTIDWKL